MAGNLRKAMGMAVKESEGAKPKQSDPDVLHAASQSASVLVQLGLAAFAVSAYIRSTLCPALQSYVPQPTQPQSQVSLLMIQNGMPRDTSLLLVAALNDSAMALSPQHAACVLSPMQACFANRIDLAAMCNAGIGSSVENQHC